MLEVAWPGGREWNRPRRIDAVHAEPRVRVDELTGLIATRRPALGVSHCRNRSPHAGRPEWLDFRLDMTNPTGRASDEVNVVPRGCAVLPSLAAEAEEDKTEQGK